METRSLCPDLRVICHREASHELSLAGPSQSLKLNWGDISLLVGTEIGLAFYILNPGNGRLQYLKATAGQIGVWVRCRSFRSKDSPVQRSPCHKYGASSMSQRAEIGSLKANKKVKHIILCSLGLSRK